MEAMKIKHGNKIADNGAITNADRELASKIEINNGAVLDENARGVLSDIANNKTKKRTK
jgi:hypothetical protein